MMCDPGASGQFLCRFGKQDHRRSGWASGPIGVAYGPYIEAVQVSNQRTPMSDKSPRSAMSKKSGKSIKEKRADKKSKSGGDTSAEIIVPKKR
jgi:hypothetical protein